MTPFETIKYKGCAIKLYQDEDAESPREWDNVGEILYTSSRYNLGDRRATSEEIQEIIDRDDVIFLPVYAYIHSGTRLNTTGFSCPWDSGQCGIIWCTKVRAVKEWGKVLFTKAVQKSAEDYLRGEIATLDSYFSGTVCGYVAEGPDGVDENGDNLDDAEEIDSCWGFYPDETNGYAKRYEYPISEAKAAIDNWLADRAQQTEQHKQLT